MSNFNFTPEEIARMVDSYMAVYYRYNNEGFSFFTLSEKVELSYFKLDPRDEQRVENAVGCFFIRCSIANQLSTLWTYEIGRNDNPTATLTIPTDAVFKAHKLGKLSPAQLYKELQSLHYNTVSNAGTSMLSAADEDKLELMQRQIADLILNGREKILKTEE